MTITRKFTALLLTVAAAAVPAAASAQPNTGSGTGDSDYCRTLKNRAQYYNDLAHNPNLPKGVRDFYSTRAQIVLIHARQAGCQWSARAVQAAPAADVDATAVSSRTATARSKYRSAENARKANKRVASSGTTTSNTNTTVARVKASPTGNGKLDSYCSAVADLITDAENQGDEASINNHDQDAAEWYELADHMTYTSTKNGCTFTAAKRAPQSTPSSPQGTATRG